MQRFWKRESFFVGMSAAFGVAVLAGILYLCGRIAMAALAVATPFVASFFVALILEPLVVRVQRNVRWIRKRRMPAVVVVYILFLLAFIALLTYFVPKVIEEGTTLGKQLPKYIASFQHAINVFLAGHRKIGPVTMPKNVDAFVTQYSGQINAKLQSYASNSAELILGSISGILTVILVPIITFFVLSDMPRLRARFLFLLPDSARPVFQHLASDVGGVFGNYIRGMVIVCSAYGLVAMGIFLLFHLEAYAILLGFAAGLLYAVPYIGALSLTTLAGIVSLSIGNSPVMTLFLLGAIFLLNLTFDNAIVPRVVGDSVGLHPLLTIFALFLGGELFGIWGMLLSVPVAASIQIVLFRLYPRLCDPTPVAMARRFEVPETESVTRSEDDVEEATERIPSTDASTSDAEPHTSAEAGNSRLSPYEMDGDT